MALKKCMAIVFFVCLFFLSTVGYPCMLGTIYKVKVNTTSVYGYSTMISPCFFLLLSHNSICFIWDKSHLYSVWEWWGVCWQNILVILFGFTRTNIEYQENRNHCWVIILDPIFTMRSLPGCRLTWNPDWDRYDILYNYFQGVFSCYQFHCVLTLCNDE